jgi:hypothetical protein
MRTFSISTAVAGATGSAAMPDEPDSTQAAAKKRRDLEYRVTVLTPLKSNYFAGTSGVKLNWIPQVGWPASSAELYCGFKEKRTCSCRSW